MMQLRVAKKKKEKKLLDGRKVGELWDALRALAPIVRIVEMPDEKMEVARSSLTLQPDLCHGWRTRNVIKAKISKFEVQPFRNGSSSVLAVT